MEKLLDVTNMLIFSDKVQTSRFIEDCDKVISFNGKPMHRGYYNLVVSIRDANLFTMGMKPHRTWRLKDVKEYFGIKGYKRKIAEQLEQLKDEYVTLQNFCADD